MGAEVAVVPREASGVLRGVPRRVRRAHPSRPAGRAAFPRQRHSDTVDVERIVKSAVHGTAIAMDLVMGWRADGTIPDDRIVDVRFADLASDPVATVGTVLERTGGSLDADADRRMRGYLDARPRHRHGVHDYDFA